MQAKIIDSKWVVEWFDERQCYHMPSLTLADNGNLLAVWNGGFLQWNGDPMGRDAKDWVSVLEPGAKKASNPDAVGCDIRYCCHDPVFLKNHKGEIILLFAKFLDTEVNFTTWCNGRDELWTRKTKDGGRTWEPAQPAGIQSGHASNDSVLLDDGTIVFASTCSELADKYFGAVRIYLSHDDGENGRKAPSSRPTTAISSASPRCAFGRTASSACSRARVRATRAGARALSPSRRIQSRAATAGTRGRNPCPQAS